MCRFVALILVVILVAPFLPAEEGMWLLTQIDGLGLQERGLAIPIQEIYDPQNPSLTDAVVWLGGCSASFVSPEGLILTNHHCAYSALQRSSTVERNLLHDGFVARTRNEEIPAIGFTASVLDTVEDITAQVLSEVGDLTDPVAHARKLAQVMTSIRDTREGGRTDALVVVANMFEGNQFLLFQFTRYRDVRLVYAPPLSVGKYGGDIDNWMWPRHTGDFTYLRAYMAPDGSGARYDPANIPVRPRRHLRIARTPLTEGDLTFILGFPGRTTRYRCSPCVRHFRDNVYPAVIRDYEERLAAIESATRTSPEGELALASTVSGINNSLKKHLGVVESMHRLALEERREARERALIARLSQPGDREVARKLLDNVRDLYAGRAEPEHRARVLNLLRGSGAGVLPSLAFSIYNTARQREMPEEIRDPEFSERAIERTVERLHLRYYGFFAPADKALLRRALSKIIGLEQLQCRDALLSLIGEGDSSLDAFLDHAYATTQLTSAGAARPLYRLSRRDLDGLDDPFLDLASLLFDDIETARRKEEEFDAQINNARRTFLRLLRSANGSSIYPDANSTMRFTFGRVEGYDPRDAVTYRPFTTLRGAAEKATGEVPFDMPEALLDLSSARNFGQWADPVLKDVPVAFTHTCDITGGNSGSAVMNARGELIGLAFDGNYEALISDWEYEAAIQRTISVDIRYVMYITEKLGGATHLLREMGVETR